MEEQNTGAKPRPLPYMDNQQTGRAIIFPISHYHKMKGQRQIVSSYLNDYNLLNAEQDTTDETIPPYKTTSI